MTDVRGVSVVIPAYNRAHHLNRAIGSVQAQTNAPIEIIVVDDASTDDTESIVRGISDSRIRYIRHPERRNAAAARNNGIRCANGEYVAFLDSDDEWLPEHLARSLYLLQSTEAGGVFGSFYLSWPEVTVEYRCASRPGWMSMAEYILSSYPGDPRTSTFVFCRSALMEIMFDESLRKHQDWDLAIRFSQRFAFVSDTEITTTIHPDADGRMSSRMEHAASAEFLGRHQASLSPRALAHTYANFARRTRAFEGRNHQFREYLRRATSLWAAASARDRLMIAALFFPGIDRLFLTAGARYSRIRRMQRGVRAVPASITQGT